MSFSLELNTVNNIFFLDLDSSLEFDSDLLILLSQYILL